MPSYKEFHNAWGAARALHAVKNKKRGVPLVVIAPDSRAQFEAAVAEFSFFAGDTPIFEFPAYIQEPFEETRVNSSVMARRSKALYGILHESDFILIVSPYSILKKISKKEDYLKNELLIKKSASLPRNNLENILDTLGYVQVEFVNGAGEYNIRGDLIDIFPIDSDLPVRIEFFDDEVETLFLYNPETQARIKNIGEVRILPSSDILLSASEISLRIEDEDIKERFATFGKFAGYHWFAPFCNYNFGTIFDYLPENYSCVTLKGTWKTDFIIFSEDILDRLETSKHKHELLSNFMPYQEAVREILAKDTLSIGEVSETIDSEGLSYKSSKAKFAFEKKNLYQSLTNALEVIQNLIKNKFRVILFLESDKFSKILKEFVRDYDLSAPEIKSFGEVSKEGLYLYREASSGGFLDDEEKIAIVSDNDIFGFTKHKSRAKKKEVFNTGLSDLEEGDYVVHVNHGIGIYKGIKRLTIGGVEGEFLHILYDGDDIFYVPLQGINQLQKYIGIGDEKPKLSSLKTSAWQKIKKNAKESAKEIAEDLLRLYAERKAKKGFSFIDDGSLLEDFERNFEYDETEDQLSAIIDVYNDMESETPMERLVCGDVGFGKTEVAMRAACKAVASSKQVAVLVPTTVLARQHFETFNKRFSPFGVNVEFASRFRTASEIKKVFGKVADGSIDILIGTHKILSKDLAFKDLGLLIIDEEQRFGVSHKEKIAAIKRNVDTLTLSATPIPRTLQLSLSGIRDMSIIETPPENRLPVIVKVIKNDDEVIKAIKYELERGGQVFFLHNKVQDISDVAYSIKSRLELARVDFAHGQMEAKALEKTLQSFYAGETDVLISTTIIENGIDIANVNTIIINNAAHFGLSQLYQLKGRVGRAKRRGYCYLAVDNFSRLTPIAQKRLSIIQQLADLGSGFKIAMYDLQLRGAGNILGAEQSGFVVRVGYELYVKMIEDAVSEMKGEFANLADTEINSNIAYFIPADYIENPRIRFDFYRRFSVVSDIKSMEEILEELGASYGELKSEVRNLAYVMLIKNLGSMLGASKINISKSGAKIELAQNTKLDLEKIQVAAKQTSIIYRFLSEYELSVVVNSDYLLKSLAEFLEIMSNYGRDI